MKVAYITGSRAEYGIMRRLLSRLEADNQIELELIVTAMHLDPMFGYTINLIKEDRYNNITEIPITLNNENNMQITSSMAECLEKFGKHFYQHHYDAVMILGDRYEMFSVATAAAMHNIPIIHLHGGEKTLGNYDEFIRHCITKMSRLHLVSTEEYRNRVIQLGENPKRVINIGSLGAENSLSLKFLPKKDIYNKIDYSKPYFVILFHPETLTSTDISEQIDTIIEVINFYKKGFDFIFIGSNSDTGSKIIYDKLMKFADSGNYKWFTSLSTEEYLSLVKYSMALIGNSSSGLIEIPSLEVPTINLGDRQLGRVRGESVIDCKIEFHEIKNAIEKVLSDQFRKDKANFHNPYYKKDSLKLALKAIKSFLENYSKLELKDFWDIN